MPRRACLALLCTFLPAAALAQDDHAHGDGHGSEAQAHEDHGHEDHGHEDHGHEDHGHEDHGHDHVHGAGGMSVTLEGYMLGATLTVPGGDLFVSEDEADHTLAEAARIVPGARALFAIPEAAGCAAATSNIEVTEIAEGDHAGHTDWTLSFGLICAEPDALEALDLAVFDTLPELERVQLEITVDDRFRLEAEMAPDTGPVTLRPFGAEQGS